MEILFYVLIFIFGTLFGSFFSLAIYRIPLGQNIVYKHSYCPHCNHKLGFLDMIPIISYIFLNGKCKYCKKPVRARYIFLEVLTGITFLTFFLSLNFAFENIEFSKIIYYMVGILYISALFIIAGIDKENKNISKPVLVYGIIVLTVYMLYLYIVAKANIYKYIIYLFMILILILIDTIILKKKGKTNYNIQIIMLCLFLSLFTDEMLFVISAILTLLTISFILIINKLAEKFNKSKKVDKQVCENLPIGFYLCTNYIIVLILSSFIFYEVII